MLVLKSNIRYNDLLKLDPDSGVVELVSRTANPGTVSIQGHFVNLDGGFACLYRWHDRIVFRFDGCAYEIPENATAELRVEGESKTLRILSDGSELCHWTYPSPTQDFIDALRDTDEADSDFGLFVHNVINDKERQRRMYR